MVRSFDPSMQLLTLRPRYIIGLTLGPTFLSSSLYLGISLLQKHHGARFAYISPKWFATLFILGDFLCLCFIGCGGSLAAIYAWNPIGVDLMIAGLGSQVLFTAIFCIVLGVLYRRVVLSSGGQHMRLYMRGTLKIFTEFGETQLKNT